MDLDEQESIVVEDGAGRTWVFSGQAGPAERWLRRVSMPAGSAPARGELRDLDVLSREFPKHATGGGSERMTTVAEIIQAMDSVRMARADRIDQPTYPDDEPERQLLAS